MERPIHTSMSYILYETPIGIEDAPDGVGGSWRSYSWFDASITGPVNGRPVAVFHSRDEQVVLFESERVCPICIDTAVRDLHQALEAHRPEVEIGYDEDGEFTIRDGSKYQRGVAYPLAMIRDEAGRLVSNGSIIQPAA